MKNKEAEEAMGQGRWLLLVPIQPVVAGFAADLFRIETAIRAPIATRAEQTAASAAKRKMKRSQRKLLAMAV